MNFHFVDEPGLKRSQLIFAKIDCIFQLNFMTEEIKVVYTYNSQTTKIDK